MLDDLAVESNFAPYATIVCKFPLPNFEKTRFIPKILIPIPFFHTLTRSTKSTIITACYPTLAERINHQPNTVPPSSFTTVFPKPASISANIARPRLHLSRQPVVVAWRVSSGGGAHLPRPALTMDDDSIWGPPGDLPPRQVHQPYHPPMVRRVAAAAERPQRLEVRRRGLLQRSISASHHQSHHDAQHHHHHHFHHHHHHHHYYHVPRAAWEYPPVGRGMPVIGEERGDWEPSNNYPAASPVNLASRRRGTGNGRRRRTFLFPWRRLRRGGGADLDDADDSFDFSYEELIELDSRNVCRGLTEEELGKLDAFEANKEHAKSDCHICLDGVECGTKVVSLKCGHLYHQGCIHTWLKMKRTCPICRCEL